MTTKDAPRFYTVAEVGRTLRLSGQTVRKLIGNGELEATTVGFHYRVPVDALERYIAEHSNKEGEQ